MNYKIENIEFLSYSKMANIKGKIYIPDTDNIKGIIQIVHGMLEYFDRYIDAIEFFLKEGYIVCGHDHLGHGDSYSKKEERGYFGEENGYKALIEDTYSVTKYVKEKYPKFNYFIIGHSMGSFITRIVVSKYCSSFDGVIFLGTGGPNPLFKTGIEVANRIAKKKGGSYQSKVLVGMSNKFFNAAVPNQKTDHDWTTRDEEIIKKRIADKKSDFSFSAKGYVDLFTLAKLANDPNTLNKIDRKMHIGLFSGDKDPVGNYGKSVIKLYEYLNDNEFENVYIKLYKGARHELLNELNREEVKKHLLKFIHSIEEDLEKEENTKITLEEYVIPQIIEENNINVKKDFAILLKIKHLKGNYLYGDKDLEVINVVTGKSRNILKPPVITSLIDGCDKLNNNLEKTFLITNNKLCTMEEAACYMAKVPVVYYLKDKVSDKDKEIKEYIYGQKGTFALKEKKFID